MLLLACGAVVDTEAMDCGSIHPFPSTLYWVHIIILCVVCVSSASVAIAFAVYTKWSGSGICLARGVMLLVWTTIVTVGIVTWLITYITSRGVIEDATLSLIQATAGTVITSIRDELSTGVNILKHVQQLVRTDLVSLASTWPRPQLWMTSILNTVGQANALHLIYYGTSEGRVHGAAPYPDQPGVWGAYIGYQPHDVLPTWVRCSPTNFRKDEFCSEAFRCRDWESSCNFNCFAGDLPNARFCHGPAGSTALIVVEAHLAETEFVKTTNSEPLLVPNFDPRVRPWYAQREAIAWTAPYNFSDTGGFGVTVAAGIWVGTEHKGTVAVDFTLSDLNRHMRRLGSAHENLIGVFLMAVPDYTLLAHSLAPEKLEEETGLPLAMLQGVLNIASFADDSRVRHAVNAVVDQFGSLQASVGCTVLLHSGGNVIMSYDMQLEGLEPAVLIMSLPHSDVMVEANSSSTFALSMAIVMSLAGAFLVFCLTNYLLAPLSALGTQMSNVAHMRLEDVDTSAEKSFISEVRLMEHSFFLMVLNLREYRNFLPQSVLVSHTDQHDTRDNGSLHSLSSSSFEEDDMRRPRESISDDEATVSITSNPLVSAPTAVGFNTSGVRYKSISLAMLNIRHFRSMSRTMSQVQLVNMHSTYLENVIETARKRNGLVDEFTGDHVSAAFNALYTCDSHRVKSADFCLAMRMSYPFQAVFEAGDTRFSVNAGVTSGRALCGNMGCQGMKKFTIVGGCASLLRVLERWGNVWEIGVLADQLIGQDAETMMYVRKVATARMYQKSPFVLYEIGSPKGLDDRPQLEWMYRLHQADQDCPYTAYNNAFDALYSEQYERARMYLRDCPTSIAAHVATFERIITACENNHTTPQVLSAFTAPSIEPYEAVKDFDDPQNVQPTLLHVQRRRQLMSPVKVVAVGVT